MGRHLLIWTDCIRCTVHALAVVLVVAAAPAWAIDLPSSEDVNDNSTAANKNYGNSFDIHIKSSKTQILTGYLRFRPDAWAKSAVIWNKLRIWCDENRVRVPQRKEVAEQLQARGCKSKKGTRDAKGKQHRGWSGVELAEREL